MNRYLSILSLFLVLSSFSHAEASESLNSICSWFKSCFCPKKEKRRSSNPSCNEVQDSLVDSHNLLNITVELKSDSRAQSNLGGEIERLKRLKTNTRKPIALIVGRTAAEEKEHAPLPDKYEWVYLDKYGPESQPQLMSAPIDLRLDTADANQFGQIPDETFSLIVGDACTSDAMGSYNIKQFIPKLVKGGEISYEAYEDQSYYAKIIESLRKSKEIDNASGYRYEHLHDRSRESVSTKLVEIDNRNEGAIPYNVYIKR